MLYLKEHRIKAGYSIPAFSKLTDIPIRTIEDIERRKDCPISKAEKFASVLGLTLDALCKSPE